MTKKYMVLILYWNTSTTDLMVSSSKLLLSLDRPLKANKGEKNGFARAVFDYYIRDVGCRDPGCPPWLSKTILKDIKDAINDREMIQEIEVKYLLDNCRFLKPMNLSMKIT